MTRHKQTKRTSQYDAALGAVELTFEAADPYGSRGLIKPTGPLTINGHEMSVADRDSQSLHKAHNIKHKGTK